MVGSDFISQKLFEGRIATSEVNRLSLYVVVHQGQAVCDDQLRAPRRRKMGRRGADLPGRQAGRQDRARLHGHRHPRPARRSPRASREPRATRLHPITTTINKHLLPLANKPMIFHAIEKVIEAGINEIFINVNPGETELQDYIELPLKSESLHILQALRDESHRFAINYHRLLRKKRQKKSELDDISGIGPARKRKLLTFFGSVKEIKKASEEQIADVVGSSLAKVIFDHFKQQSEKISRKKKTSRKKAVSSFSKKKK